MSLYVLDTDILSLYQKNHSLVVARVDGVSLGDQIAVTVMSVEEQLSGWYRRLRKAKNDQELARTYSYLANSARFWSRWPILNFSEPAIARFRQLKSQRLNIGGSDLAIAAITLEHNAILVSRNLRDFQRVPGLQVEDWSV